MTSYHIEVGYNSTHSKPAVGRRLIEVVEDLQALPEKIGAEVIRIEPNLNPVRLRDFTESYRIPVQDLTLKISEDCERENLPVVTQLASSGSGGDTREYKEACRRAVCRLVLEAMHREGMEINISVR